MLYGGGAGGQVFVEALDYGAHFRQPLFRGAG